MKRAILALGLALALVGVIVAEPYYTTVSATQAVQSKALPSYTTTVVLVSDGASSTCYFRLFVDCDTPGNATTASAQLKSGERLEYTLVRARSSDTEYPQGVRDSESYCANGQRAKYYKSLSVICAAGQTATWRVFAK